MALPRKMKMMNLTVDGVGYYGECTEVTLPKLAMKTEDYRAGGMVGDVKINMGLEALELTAKFGGLMFELHKKFANSKIDGNIIRFTGAYQKENDAGYDAVEIVGRGRIVELDGGSAKAGDNTEESIKFALTYYKEVLNGEDITEIDLLNNVMVIGGVDQLEEARQAIGM